MTTIIPIEELLRWTAVGAGLGGVIAVLFLLFTDEREYGRLRSAILLTTAGAVLLLTMAIGSQLAQSFGFNHIIGSIVGIIVFAIILRSSFQSCHAWVRKPQSNPG